MTQQMYEKKNSVWQGNVHASFRKVIAYDALFMVLGALIGAGVGVAIFLH